jgi:formylmethanofuran dehydrogenase subunit B
MVPRMVGGESTAAWIEGRPAGIDEAIDSGAERLAAARAPLLAGLVADVDAIRAAYDLAARLGAALDCAASASLYPDLAVLASAGAMMTTPSEALARADVVLAVGRAAEAPVVAELMRTTPARGQAAGAARRSVAIGDGPGGDAGRLPPLLGELRAVAAGRLSAPEPKLAEAAELLKRAAFGVAVYDPGELGDLAVDMLQGLVKDLNETTRFSSLALPDPLQGRTALAVGLWTAGAGPRVGFGRGGFAREAEHDPWRFDAARLMESGEADAVLWLAALPCPLPPWHRPARTVALMGEADGEAAAVVIRVAVPGETAPGTLWDARRGALVHREPSRPGGPSRVPAATVLAALAAAAGAARC